MKIHELFTDARRWTQGTFARNARGETVATSNPAATCWCLEGAMMRCYPNMYEQDRVNTTIRRELGLGGGVVTWNDAPERTFDEVKALVTALDI